MPVPPLPPPPGWVGELRMDEVKCIDDLAISPDTWNDLASRCSTNSIFQSHEWLSSWWQVFAGKCELLILVFRVRDELVGIAPLMLVHAANGLRELRFIGTGNADYLDFMIPEHPEQVLRAVCRYLVGRRHAWDSIYLANLPEKSPSVHALKAALAEVGLAELIEARVPCFEVTVEGHHEQLARQLSRYRWRRPVNWFRKHGEVRFRVLRLYEEVEPYLETFFAQHTERWHHSPSVARFGDPLQRQLFRNLTRSLSDRGWLSFAVLELEGRPIAFHFGFEFGGCLVWYKPSFDVRLRHHSPGTALFKYLLEHAISSGMRCLDLTVGEEDFKRRIADAQSSNIYVRIHGNRRRYLLARGYNALRRAAAQCRRLVRRSVHATGT